MTLETSPLIRHGLKAGSGLEALEKETLGETTVILWNTACVDRAFTAGGPMVDAASASLIWIHQQRADLIKQNGRTAQPDEGRNFPKVCPRSRTGNEWTARMCPELNH